MGKRKHTSPKGNNSKLQATDMNPQTQSETHQAAQLAQANTLAQLQHMFPPGFQPFTPTNPPVQYFSSPEEPQWAKRIFEKISNIENSMAFISNEFEKFRNDITNIQKEVCLVKEENRRLTVEIENIKDSIIENKSRSMRNNLLLHGIKEVKDENCEETVRNFIQNQLNIDTKDIEIERSHRIGRFQKDKQRPIVSRFLRFKDKETIKKSSFKLKGSTFGLSDQYPREINEKRTLLRTVEKHEKSQGRPTFLQVDKLFTPGWCHFVRNGKVEKVASKRPVYPPRRPNDDDTSLKASRRTDPGISFSQVLTGANEVLHGDS